MIDGHEVLVADAGADREASRVVGVELADGFDPEVEFFGKGRRERVLDGGSSWGGEVGEVGLGWAYAFLGLREVALYGLVAG